jgi:hypothetical protein
MTIRLVTRQSHRQLFLNHDSMGEILVDVRLTNAFDVERAAAELLLGNEVLIGQTILEKLDLLADCKNRRLVPNPDHPNQPVTKII